MKKNLLITSLILILLLTGCSFTENKFISESTAPTGGASEEISLSTVFYQGSLYESNNQGTQSSIAEKYQLIRELTEHDPNSLPSTDFAATGLDLEEGQSVYAETTDSPDVLFIKAGDSYLPLLKETKRKKY